MKVRKVALAGNPNAGKSSVFNHLTGLNQKVGNYPGVTIDKKTGQWQIDTEKTIEVIDLPGTYSIYPRSEDEKVVHDLLSNPDHPDFPDVVVVIVDASNLQRNLLLFTQIYDLNIPVILALNMMDLSDKKGQLIDLEKMGELFGGVPVVRINGRKGEGFDQLKTEVQHYKFDRVFNPFIAQQAPASAVVGDLPEVEVELQVKETEQRYKQIRTLLPFAVQQQRTLQTPNTFHRRTDRILVHPVSGYLTFLFILFVMFQAVYSLAEGPMELIDRIFFQLSQITKVSLPEGIFTDLLAEGIIPGLGGVIIFIPQIVILFLFIAVLEESGYMARVVFIMDRLMRPFGLNGKSIVPLLSGLACAVPAVMAARTISNWKERMITIMVTPLMSCAARLPVYTLLIALVIPDQYLFGWVSLKGLTLLGMYIVGTLMALFAAFIFNLILQNKASSFLLLELPDYRWPRWKNIMLTLWEKTKIFILEAGKVILAISIILWVLASFGPPGRMDKAAQTIPLPSKESAEAKAQYDNEVNSIRLENSWIGMLGKTIEPAIAPLGYDWKIGIALLTSFAAREVFVGSMATIYSVGEDFEEGDSLIQRMKGETHWQTGKPVYTLATGISLMLFYAFAMQCMSTLAIVYRETKSWKWPLIQLAYMTILAYLAALLAYQLLSL